MEKYEVKIKNIEQLTPDIKKIIVERPTNYKVIPGQHARVSVNRPGMDFFEAPFSIYLEGEEMGFIIKEYPRHEGLTKAIHELSAGDELVISDPRGAISYQKEGVFIAGGTGIVPFLSIFDQLRRENGGIGSNQLIFSNRTQQEIIMEKELKNLFGNKVSFVLTREEKEGYDHGRIDKDYLEKKITDLSQDFYICGPLVFVNDVTQALEEMGVTEDQIVYEGWAGR